MTLSPHTSARRWLLFALILLGAFALRLWELNDPSIWHDEAWSIRAIRDPIDTPDDNTPPLYYGLMHVLWLGAGESPLALRYGSVLIDVVTVALVIGVVRRWAHWDTAVLAGILMALSPLLWAYAREIRAYVMVPLLTVLLLYMADRMLAARRGYPWRRVVPVIVVELALLYTHNLSVPVVAWLNGAVGLAWVLARRWTWLAWWIGGQVVVLVAYLPWVLQQSPSGTPLNTPPEISMAQVWEIWQAYFAPVPGQIGDSPALVLASALIGVTVVLSAALVVDTGPDRPAYLVLSQAVLLPVLATVELLAASIDFHPRYYVAGVPAALMLVALAADRMPGMRLRTLAVSAGTALAFAAAAASIPALLSEARYQRDDFEAVASYYATLPEDALIVIPYGWEPALEEYYVDHLDIRADIVGIDLHSTAEEAIKAINGALADRELPAAVELLDWFQLPADLRGMYPCLLGAAGKPVGGPLTVKGIASQAYEVREPLALAALETPNADFGVLHLTGAATEGRAAICVESTWQLAAATSQDWRVSARLQTRQPSGWTLAQRDNDIRTADQVPTSDWAVGDTGAAYNLLELPPGAPPESYLIEARVYSEAEPNGLARLEDGNPVGAALALGAVEGSRTRDAIAWDDSAIEVRLAVSESVQLLAVDAPEALHPGQDARITLYWQASELCCGTTPWQDADLVLRGDGWSLAQPVQVYGPYSRDWHGFSVPAEAQETAELALVLPDGTSQHLARLPVETADRLFTAPGYQTPLAAAFTDVAVLEGFTLETARIPAGEDFTLTLVWQAQVTPVASYVVFNHLLDANGRVIAQHDGVPVDGTRPTTSWVAGEYLVDTHRLEFLHPDYRGPAHLEVGLYNPETGARVPLSRGGDHIVLPVEIVVE